MRNQNTFDPISIILLVIGGLNWGVIGLLGFDPIDSIFGPAIAQVIFSVIGLAAAYKIGVWIAQRTK